MRGILSLAVFLLAGEVSADHTPAQPEPQRVVQCKSLAARSGFMHVWITVAKDGSGFEAAGAEGHWVSSSLGPVAVNAFKSKDNKVIHFIEKNFTPTPQQKEVGLTEVHLEVNLILDPQTRRHSGKMVGHFRSFFYGEPDEPMSCITPPEYLAQFLAAQ